LEKLGLTNKLKAFNLDSTEEILGIDKLRRNENEKIQEIPLSKIRDFKNHPFKVCAGEQFDELIESIKINGVLNPTIVRRIEQDENSCEFEMISGHRRKKASKIAGLETIPCIIRNLDDDQATIIMVDSNMQRENILPSEKAFAYRMKLDAMNRQGRRTDLTSSQLGTRLIGTRSDQILAEQTGESRNQIQRYIRLTFLISSILKMVDEKKIALNPSVELSYLDEKEQHMIELVLEENKCKIDQNKASLLRENSGNLNVELAANIIIGNKDSKDNKLKPVKIKSQVIKKYFKPEQKQEEIEDIIEKALHNYFVTIQNEKLN